MGVEDKVNIELDTILKDSSDLVSLCQKKKNLLEFGSKYQSWYSRALKLVSLIGSDRLDEFRSYYLIDPKRKATNAGNYVIQDYIKE
jgi:hypothetical protein